MNDKKPINEVASTNIEAITWNYPCKICGKNLNKERKTTYGIVVMDVAFSNELEGGFEDYVGKVEYYHIECYEKMLKEHKS